MPSWLMPEYRKFSASLGASLALQPAQSRRSGDRMSAGTGNEEAAVPKTRIKPLFNSVANIPSDRQLRDSLFGPVRQLNNHNFTAVSY